MWAAILFSRVSHFRSIQISFLEDAPLKYWSPPQHVEWLHRIDQDAGGIIGGRSKIGMRDDNERYLFSSLMEEAIASSQLEGATTTREIAKRMLRTKRKPRDTSEQMIFNNYNAILAIRDLSDENLTPELICRLHSVITENTLDNEDAAGRFRHPDEEVVIEDQTTGDVIYTPPSADSFDLRIAELCRFANTKDKEFIHPVIKAISLHFAIGFIHPFTDGNGRTARALFYWYIQKRGYWIFEYLPISRIFLNAPVKYARAYLYTELDSGDLTYFIHYHLEVIVRAIRELHEYLLSQERDVQEATKLLKSFRTLNHRQKDVLYKALKNPATSITIRQHAGEYHITKATARSDLFALEKDGALEKVKQGRQWIFFPVKQLVKRLRKRVHQIDDADLTN